MKLQKLIAVLFLSAGLSAFAVEATPAAPAVTPAPATTEPAKPADPAKPAEAKPYTLDTCLVTGKKVDDSTAFVVSGQEFKTCCQGCPKKVKADPETYIKKLEVAMKEKAPK